MADLFRAMLDAWSALAIAGQHATLIAAAATLPMLSLASWHFISRRLRGEPRDIPVLPRDTTSALAGAAGTDTPDPLKLYEAFARKHGSHVLVLPSGDRSLGRDDLANKAREAIDIGFGDFLRAYRRIPADMPIDVILPYDFALPLSFVSRAARLLASHRGKVTAYVPHQAFGPTCLLLLAAAEVRIWRDAALVFDLKDVASTIKAARLKGARRMDDRTLLDLHDTKQHMRETRLLAEALLRTRGVRRARAIARAIADGHFHEGNPGRVRDLVAWGLNVRVADVIEALELPDAQGPSITLASASRNLSGGMARVAPTCTDACPIGDVRSAMVSLETRRNSKVISIIHAPGTSSFMLDQETTAEAIKAIRSAAPGTNLDIILHTPGGMSLGADQLVRVLKEHRGTKTFFVPYEAYSAGTILALTGDSIAMTRLSTIGPIDTQIGINDGPVNQLLAVLDQPDNAFGLIRAFYKTGAARSHLPAAALASLLKFKPAASISDPLLRLAVLARDRIRDDHRKALALMAGNYSRWTANRIAHALNDGTLSHGYPLQYDEAKRIGLHVTLGIPDEVYTIVDSFLFQPGEFCSVIHCSGDAEATST